MPRSKQPDVRDLLGRTLLPDARERIDAVRALSAALSAAGEGRPGDGEIDADRLVDDAWDRVIELARDPDRAVRRTVLHVLAEAPPDRDRDVERTLDQLRRDQDDALRQRARKVHAQFRRGRAA